ncbi:MAG: oxidoreductase [Armatimonadota bacterium]
MSKPKVALYWAASCGGCEIAVLQIGQKVLDLADAVDIVFWPVALDFKVHHVEAMDDGSIDLCLFNGGIRTSEQEEIAHLLRAKSKVMVAFGACAHLGGIPGLANFHDRDEIFDRAYHESQSTDNPERTVPQTSTQVPAGELELPAFYNTVRTLDQTVQVEYYVPGCPPEGDRIWEVLAAVLSGELPPPGSVVGALEKTCCEECEREREEKKLTAIHRPHEIKADPEQCLLDQGVICVGPATRAGCGAKCPTANMPCRGCYGPPANVLDQGAKMLSAVASVIDSEDEDTIQEIIAQIKDPGGTFYRFGLARSLLRRRYRPIAHSEETALPAESARAAAKG